MKSDYKAVWIYKVWSKALILKKKKQKLKRIKPNAESKEPSI